MQEVLGKPKYIFLDWETYYEAGVKNAYSLSNPELTTAEYITDKRFEILGVGVSTLGGHTYFYRGPDKEYLRAQLANHIDENTVVIAHNANFDGAILEWVIGLKPARYFCTYFASMPHVMPFTGSASLDNAARHFQVGSKIGGLPANKRAKDLNVNEWFLLERYCRNDLKQLHDIFLKLDELMPWSEQLIIDQTVKKFIRPKFILDKEVLAAAHAELEAERCRMLLIMPAGVDESVLRSDTKLAAWFQSQGVAPPKKASATTGQQAFAFAKSDKEFLALRNHPNSDVRNVVEARLLFKSSIEKSRLERFMSLADKLDKLPIPLLYYGAHTGRFSGSDRLNLQNLPRGSALRKALKAPEGYKVIAADLSSIEARIVATLAGQLDLVEQFRRGEDVYCNFASILFGRPITPADEKERFIGKTCILGLGYGLGATKFLSQMEVKVPGISLIDTQRYVNTYRRTYANIPLLWRKCDDIVKRMLLRDNADYGFVRTKIMVLPNHIPGNQPHIIPYVRLPNDMPIYYPSLTTNADGGASYNSWIRAGAPVSKKLYGGALLENITQALARIIITSAELRLAKFGLNAALQVHDELVYIVPDAAVDAASKAIKAAMSTAPSWLPTLPVACKVGVGQSYADAK